MNSHRNRWLYLQAKKKKIYAISTKKHTRIKLIEMNKNLHKHTEITVRSIKPMKNSCANSYSHTAQSQYLLCMCDQIEQITRERKISYKRATQARNKNVVTLSNHKKSVFFCLVCSSTCAHIRTDQQQQRAEQPSP